MTYIDSFGESIQSIHDLHFVLQFQLLRLFRGLDVSDSILQKDWRVRMESIRVKFVNSPSHEYIYLLTIIELDDDG